MTDLTIARLRELIAYDPKSGILTWKRRALVPGNEQHIKIWNARWAGREVGWLNDGGYRVTSIDSRKHLVARLAWAHYYGRWPSRDVDHKDRHHANNAIRNLRLATVSQNIMNSKRRADNTSGFKGVSEDKRDGRWQAYINVRGQRISLGRYGTAREAHGAYIAAAKTHHGRFARLS